MSRVCSTINRGNQPRTLSLSKGRYLLLATTVVLSLLTLFMLPRTTHACLCASSGSPKEAMAKADAVFLGKVIAVHLPGPTLRNGQPVISSADMVKVDFRVSKVWKGPRREILTVETERSEISCGFEFEEGRRYIVYTWGGNRTGFCTRTAPAWLAARDFTALGFGERPESAMQKEGTTSSPGTCNAPAHAGRNRTDLAAIASIIRVAALSAWRKRRL